MVRVVEWFAPTVVTIGLLAMLASLYSPLPRMLRRFEEPSSWLEKHERYVDGKNRLGGMFIFAFVLTLVIPWLMIGGFSLPSPYVISGCVGSVAIVLHITFFKKLQKVAGHQSEVLLTKSEKYRNYIPSIVVLGTSIVNYVLFPTSLDPKKLVVYLLFFSAAMFFANHFFTFLKFLGLIRQAPENICRYAAEFGLDPTEYSKFGCSKSMLF